MPFTVIFLFCCRCPLSDVSCVDSPAIVMVFTSLHTCVGRSPLLYWWLLGSFTQVATLWHTKLSMCWWTGSGTQGYSCAVFPGSAPSFPDGLALLPVDVVHGRQNDVTSGFGEMVEEQTCDRGHLLSNASGLSKVTMGFRVGRCIWTGVSITIPLSQRASSTRSFKWHQCWSHSFCVVALCLSCLALWDLSSFHQTGKGAPSCPVTPGHPAVC